MGRNGSSESRSSRDVVRLAIGGILVVVLLALILDNTRKVRIGYVFGHKNMPLVVLVILSALLGAAVTWLIMWRRDR